MKNISRRKFLKFSGAGLAGLAASGLTRMPIFRLGKAFAMPSDTAWSFGVLGDTQWTVDYNDANPNGVPVSIISQINPQFINLGVKFVIQVGDLTEDGQDAAIVTRSDACADLYAAGIGFFPVRGNHETYALKNMGEDNEYAIPKIQEMFPQTRGGGSYTVGAYNFSSSPCDETVSSGYSALDGISYSFDYGDTGNNIRCLMLDTWATPGKAVTVEGLGSYPYGYTVNDQQAWISERLDKSTRGTEHAFVFTHQNLMGQNHQDTFFNGYTNANTDWQNAFYASMAENDARYIITGHDHIHQRSNVLSPDGANTVEELICASCSSKFYTPKSLTDSKWYEQKYRETSISQEMYTVGFYIYTIDGPIVTVDFYSDTTGNWGTASSYPEFEFAKKETWGYSLSDSGVTTFTVEEGENYTINTTNTEAKILKAGGTATDYNGRSFEKPAAAWWEEKSTVTNANAISDVVTVIGAASAAVKVTNSAYTQNDPVCIQLSYDSSVSLSRSDLNQGRNITLCVRDDDGNWANAVDANFGGTKRFVYGPYNKRYPLGTYGFDNTNKVAWAVVNHDSDFAVIQTGN